MAKAKTLTKAAFIESMECLPVTKLPEGSQWTYEIELDGYRLEAVKKGGATTLYSRRANVLNGKFQYIADALKTLPDRTVIDGELVAVDPQGRSDFNLLQNFRSAASQIHYFAFDVLIAKGRRVTDLPLSERREILSKLVEPFAIPTQGENVERNGSNYFKKSPNDLHIIARFLGPGMPHAVQESVRLSVAR